MFVVRSALSWLARCRESLAPWLPRGQGAFVLWCSELDLRELS